MRQEFSGARRIPLAEAKQRALDHLDSVYPSTAADLANAIWPDHLMAPQGAGGAASRVMKHLCDEGTARWVVIGGTWGYIRVWPED